MTAPDAPREFRDPDACIRRAKRGNPEFDQHFLVDDRVLDRIPGYLPADADRSHLLEIGGGTGVLTERLLAVAGEGTGTDAAREVDDGPGEAGDGPDESGGDTDTTDGGSGRVTVVERDPDLAAFLRREFADDVDAGRLDVREGDALEVDLPEFSACVSNLPYGISSEIAFRLLPEKKPLVLMFQREFAERMVADADDDEYGRLSVSAQHYADVELVERVPKEAFDPQPRVQSAIVRCTPRDPAYEVDDEQFFLRFVKALFTQRRKTLRNAVRNTAHISGLSDPDAVVDAADESLMSRRAGTVTPAEFAELATLAARVDAQ